MMDFQKAMKLDVQKMSFEIERNALQSLNDDFIKADAAAQSAKGQYETFKTRRDALRANGNAVTRVPANSLDPAPSPPAGMSEVDIADQILSLEMKQYIDNDATVKTLVAGRLQWEQELGAEDAKAAPSS